MDPKCTRHLKIFKEYIDRTLAVAENNAEYPKCAREIDCKIIEDISDEMSKTSLALLEKLEKAGKMSKIINQKYAKMCGPYSSEDEALLQQEMSKVASTDEDETMEGVKEQELSKHESVDQRKTTSSHEVPLPPDCFIKKYGERKIFLVRLNVSNFSPKELEVKVHDKYLEIHAKQIKSTDKHGIISREFTRKFDIPAGVDPETFRCLFDCYDVLHVEASFMPENSTPREIKVLLDEETGIQNLGLSDGLGPEFEEMTQRHIQDGYDMAAFARNLAKQEPYDYIPS